MQLHRRTLIMSAFVSLGAGKMADAKLLITPDQALRRYRDAVVGQYQMIEGIKAVKVADPVAWRHSAALADWLKQSNGFFDMLMDNFSPDNPEDPVMVAQCREIFAGKYNHLDTMSIDDLMKISDGVVPVLVARSCIQKHKLPFDSQRMPSFNTFARRHRTMIMG